MYSVSLVAAFVEPFFYPAHTWFAVTGNIQALFRVKEWGSVKRKGFDKKKTKEKKYS